MHSTKMRTVLHMRPNLSLIQGQLVYWREVLSRSVDDPQLDKIFKKHIYFHEFDYNTFFMFILVTRIDLDPS